MRSLIARSNRWWIVIAAGLSIATTLTAQQPSAPSQPSATQPSPPVPPGLKSGNPTPGTPQPEPPNLADRITLTGCVERLSDSGTVRDASQADANSANDARFQLTHVERGKAVPPGTGRLAGDVSAEKTYRLKGIESLLSPFVGAQVEISGEIIPGATTAGSDTPVLQVEFVQKMSSTC